MLYRRILQCIFIPADSLLCKNFRNNLDDQLFYGTRHFKNKINYFSNACFNYPHSRDANYIEKYIIVQFSNSLGWTIKYTFAN